MKLIIARSRGSNTAEEDATGFTRVKNAANIMIKNLMDFAAGSLAFYILGSATTELKGLDITEHGQDAYASFQFFSNI
ncbi:MAG: hypothetical protein II946_02650 [Kiritimatiellae bacterium]|nr:hypothetical protein [Kiritimatiellia bacterium]